MLEEPGTPSGPGLSSFLQVKGLRRLFDFSALNGRGTGVRNKELYLGLARCFLGINFPYHAAERAIERFVHIQCVRIIYTADAEDKEFIRSSIPVSVLNDSIAVSIGIDHKAIGDVAERRLASGFCGVFRAQLYTFHAAALSQIKRSQLNPAVLVAVSAVDYFIAGIGNASDIKDAAGRPLLRDVAVNAARQWKHSRALLNGVAGCQNRIACGCVFPWIL